MLFTKQTKPTLFNIPIYSLLKPKKARTHTHREKAFKVNWELVLQMLAANYCVEG